MEGQLESLMAHQMVQLMVAVSDVLSACMTDGLMGMRWALSMENQLGNLSMVQR